MRFFSTLVASVLGSMIAIGLVFFIGFLFVTALMTLPSSSSTVVRSGSVLVLELSGDVPEIVSHDPFSKVFGVESSYDLADVKRALKMAAVDDRISGVWLRMRGVGAAWSTLQEIRVALLSYKESEKPLIASSGEYMMAERDYFLASTADSVFASPEAFFEFNGLYLEVMFFKGLLDKLNIEPTIIRAGTYKAAVEPFLRDDMSEENRTQLQALLDAHNALFIDAIAESRGRDAADMQRLTEDGAFITAGEAHEAGLLDGLLFEDEVESRVKALLEIEQDEDLRRIDLQSYIRVPLSEAGVATGNDGHIAIVYAVGTILSGDTGSGRGVIGSATFNKAMRQVRNDDRIKAVVVRINSPGGSAVASDAMWREIDLTAVDKPVIVSMGDLAASGGYWIATAADTIVADPRTLTGSIGVFGVLFNLGDMFESKLGITTDRVTTSDYADMFSGMRPLDSQERAVLERAINTTYEQFLQKVSDSRGLDVAAVDAIGQGRIWTGQQAFELGLVDVLGGIDTAIAIAAEQAGLEEGAYRTRLLPRPRTMMEELNEAFALQVGRIMGLPGALEARQQLLQGTDLIEQTLRMQGVPQARIPMDITVR